MPRLLQHLLHTPLATRRAFPVSVRENLRRAITEGEQTHRGEIRFVVEGNWPLGDVLRGKTVRDRALEVFGLTRVWDTHENTGLLVYVLFCERRVEILADRGLHAATAEGAWGNLCAELTDAYRADHFEAGSLRLLAAVNALLKQHFPSQGSRPNELPDMPIVIR
jgi:uncharacterized membrane protein